MKKRIKSVLFVFSLFTFLVFSQNYVGDSDSVNYRGKREPRETGSFSVLNISTSRIDSNTVRLDILFNQTVDPKSAENAIYFINGIGGATKGKTEFSKDGKKIRIAIEAQDSDFVFEMKGISSYNGKTLSPLREKLRDNGEVRFSVE